jgi:heptosyltransferase-3
VWDWTALQLFSNAEIVNRLKAAGITTIIHLSQSKRIATLARRAGIPFRITNLKGLPNWFYCNRWVNLPDERMDLHEAARNINMLKPLGIQPKLDRSDIATYIRLNPTAPLPAQIESLLDKNCFNLILHPGSNGHGCEWPVAYFKQLIKDLSEKHPGKFKIFITGGPQERERFEDLLKESAPHVVDVMGAMSLDEFLTFLSRVDGLVASGTGPLHVSAALGVKTLGLFPPKNGISLTRWAPLGKQAQALVCDHTEPCTTCPGSTSCCCMAKIPVQQVLSVLEEWN